MFCSKQNYKNKIKRHSNYNNNKNKHKYTRTEITISRHGVSRHWYRVSFRSGELHYGILHTFWLTYRSKFSFVYLFIVCWSEYDQKTCFFFCGPVSQTPFCVCFLLCCCCYFCLVLLFVCFGCRFLCFARALVCVCVCVCVCARPPRARVLLLLVSWLVGWLAGWFFFVFFCRGEGWKEGEGSVFVIPPKPVILSLCL